MTSIIADEPRVFSYDELSRATNGFNSNLLIGRGGFGEVFKGEYSMSFRYCQHEMYSPCIFENDDTLKII